MFGDARRSAETRVASSVVRRCVRSVSGLGRRMRFGRQATGCVGCTQAYNEIVNNIVVKRKVSSARDVCQLDGWSFREAVDACKTCTRATHLFVVRFIDYLDAWCVARLRDPLHYLQKGDF